MVAGFYPGFDRTRNSAIQSADPENSTLEPNLKWNGWDDPLREIGLCEIWPFEIRHIARLAFRTPILEGRGGHSRGVIDHIIGKSDVGFLYA